MIWLSSQPWVLDWSCYGRIVTADSNGKIQIRENYHSSASLVTLSGSSIMAVLPNNQGIITSNGNCIKFWYIGKQVNLDVGFRSSLFFANAQLYTGEETLHVHTVVPCEAGLKAMAAALQTLCPNQPLTITVTATDLRITEVLDESLFADLKNLCQVFGASKLTPAPVFKPVADLYPLEMKRNRTTGLFVSPSSSSMTESSSSGSILSLGSK